MRMPPRMRSRLIDGQPEGLQPVAEVGAHALAAQLAQLLLGGAVADHPAEVLLQLAYAAAALRQTRSAISVKTSRATGSGMRRTAASPARRRRPATSSLMTTSPASTLPADGDVALRRR